MGWSCCLTLEGAAVSFRNAGEIVCFGKAYSASWLLLPEGGHGHSLRM